MSLVNTLLLHALLLLLVAGSVAGLIAGVMLVLRPAWLVYVSAQANRWIATRQIDRLLEQAVKVDRWFYRHHRVSGTVLLTGALFLIYFFVARFDKQAILSGLLRAYPVSPVLLDVLLDSLVLSILLGAAFASIISLFLLSRPSMLKGFEQGANQWISLRRALKPFEIARSGMDEYVFQNVQMTGVLLLSASIYVLAGLAVWLG